MAEAESALRQGRRYAVEWVVGIMDDLRKNNLWKRMLKNVIATTLLVSICLIPGSKTAIGKAAYLGAITTVFGHPGRRFGQMAEALILVVSGTLLGVAWSLLAVYLGSLVIERNPPAAYAIRGVFLAIVALIHGYLRSRTPRLFIFVLLMVIVSVVTLTSTAKAVTTVSATQIVYPILIAVGCIILVNVCIFPDFSSRFLGQMTIDTLNDTAKALRDAGHFFVEIQLVESKTEAFSGEEKRSDSAGKGECSSQKDSNLANVSTFMQFMKFIHLQGLFAHYFQYHNVKNLQPRDQPGASLLDLAKSKAQIRQKLASCRTAQQECNFEVAVSVLPPRDMKIISATAMKRLVANTIAVISACESKFALLGDDEGTKEPHEDDIILNQSDKEVRPGVPPQHSQSSRQLDASGLGFNNLKQSDAGNSRKTIDGDKSDLEVVKPKREIEFGDARLFRYLLRNVAKPYGDLHLVAARSVEVISTCLAFAYNVPTLPSGTRVPAGITDEELDLHQSNLQQALLRFDSDASSAFEGVNVMEEMKGLEPDIMPREEVFLVSSFLLNVRQAVSTHLETMLKHCQELVRRRQHRKGRKRIYAPRIKWSKWLYTGGAEDEAMPTPARKANRGGDSKELDDDEDDSSSTNPQQMFPRSSQDDVEKNAASTISDTKPTKRGLQVSIPILNGAWSQEQDASGLSRLRGHAADVLEWMQNSEDLLYAVKLSVALFLVLWPAFITAWNTWYSLNRGLWAALQLVLITEVSIGTSVMTFFLRGIGTTIGCLWGYAAIEARHGNRIVCAVMICIGLVPCVYVQLGTKYPKAGMVCIVSICVVALSAELETVPGTPTEDYLKRWIAFLIGGSVALFVEVVLVPVKARTRLVDSLAIALRQINEMERCIASGIESGKKINIYSPQKFLRFEHARSKANTALSAAETFLPFCRTEPRIKGSFDSLTPIYSEILFVLHQIVDRMDNMLQLRTAYGSGPLEEFNAEIYPYRRNVAGSITLTLFAIHSALTMKLPLPQYLPSARLAHLRLINRVREVVLEKVGEGQESQDVIARLARQRAVRRKYMSWNAASAAQAEIIEFLEELIDLTKLLVGANEFRSGLLTRPTYQDYAGKGEREDDADRRDEGSEARVESGGTRVDLAEAVSGGGSGAKVTTKDSGTGAQGVTRRRRGTTLSVKSGDELPASLRRIQSRKMEASLKKQRTNES